MPFDENFESAEPTGRRMKPARLALVSFGAVVALAASAALLALAVSGRLSSAAPALGAASWWRAAAYGLGVTGPLGLAILVVFHLRDARQGREQFQRLESRYRESVRELLDALRTPVAVWRATSQQAWPNRTLTELLHNDRGDAGVRRWHWQDHLSPVDWPKWEQALAAARQSGRPQTLKARFLHAGSESEWLARLTPCETSAGRILVMELRGADDAVAHEALDRMRELLAMAETEKWRFGQAVHDELGQRLSGIAYFAKALQRKLAGAQRTEADDARWLTDLANESMAVSRTLARGLNPVGSDDPEALAASLHELCRNNSRMFGVECSLEADSGFDAGGAARANHVYHAVQELMTNAVRHGGARVIQVRLERGPQGQQVTVFNDGAPLGSAATGGRRGMGLAGVRSRVAHLEGEFRLADEPTGGVIASIELPLSAAPVEGDATAHEGTDGPARAAENPDST